MTREMTWLEREDNPPDVAPLADQNEPVMLRVSIGQREAPRVTIPRLDPPAEPRQKNEGEAEDGQTKRTWPASKEELEQLVREGLTNKEIADLYDVATITVATRLQKLGIRRDPETLAKLRTRNGRKGREAGWKHNHVLFQPKTPELPESCEEPPEVIVPEQGDTPASQGAPAPAGEQEAVQKFAAYLARAILQARAMGLDVEVRLRAGVRRDG